jgi:hypothetical protein
MKKYQSKLGVVAIALFAACCIISCSKNSSLETTGIASTQSVSLLLTDGPGLFDKVYLDIKDVKVLLDTTSHTEKHDSCDFDRMGDRDHHQPDSGFVWQDLNVKTGVYDILSLRNGIDTVLASGTIKAGSIRVIRIDLGTRNSLVKDSVTYPLNLLPNAPSYIIIKLKGNEFERTGTANRLWLDFDVQRSIVQIRAGQFYLSPFITAFLATQSGTITGMVQPSASLPAIVSVFSATDTLYAITNRDGFFKVRGLKDGTYSVYVNPSNIYKPTLLTNKTIKNASTENVGTITLVK